MSDKFKDIYTKELQELNRRVIMKERIIEAAGKIWHFLKENGETGMALLPRRLKEKTEIVHQALGWLAREDKLQYREKNGKTYVALNE
jgi:hypothetical protein